MIGNIFPSMFYLLVASLLFVTVSSVATTTKTEKDLVSVIIASLEGHSEVSIITEYLEMSRDALTKELPLESSGKKKIAIELKYRLTILNLIFDCSE